MHTNASTIDHTIIIPCFNEGHVIGAMIDDVITVLEKHGGSYEVIVVDDGSDDDSAVVISECERTHANVRALLMSDNYGKGSAIRHGLTYARGATILFVDGDREIPAENISTFLDFLSATPAADVVIGSKFCEGAAGHVSWKRRIFSSVYRLMNTILFGLSVKDTQMGIKAMRRHVRTRLLPYLHINGYAFDIEFLIHAARQSYIITELPVDVHIDPTQSRITHLSIAEMISDTFAVYHNFIRRDLRRLWRLEPVRIRAASARHLAVLPLAFMGSAAARGVIILISLIIVCVSYTNKKRATRLDRCPDAQQ